LETDAPYIVVADVSSFYFCWGLHVSAVE
jgi:hypothetical protein